MSENCNKSNCASCLRHALFLVSVVVAHGMAVSDAQAQVLIGNPFINNGYSGWVDAFPAPTRAGNWRLSLHNPTLMDTNNANPPTSGATVNAGTYEPDVMYQNNFTAPSAYDLTATMRTNDDDIIGLVWNYQDPNNYFRVGIRTQAAGTFGGTQGLAVQKIVNGVLTQISPAGTGAGAATPITQAMINNRTPFNLKVAVNGSNYQVLFDNTPIVSGSDPDLAAGRKIGFQSWAQVSDTDETPDPPFWGSEIESVAVTQGANTLYSQSFASRNLAWRVVDMTNTAGGKTTNQAASKEAIGNFGLDINDPWILQHSNGFVNATAGNVDFIGPAIVVDSPGSTSLTNYQMKVRMGSPDNDGYGVLVRAQDDNNFYRINFTNEATDVALTTRAPRGMSVQKVRNGAWTELYRDDANPIFVPTPGTAGSTPSSGLPMFDLSVGAVGNSLKIQVRDHTGVVYNYPLITDSTDPLLNGTVGLAVWGTDNVYYMGHGGQNTPLVTTLTAFTTLDATVDRSNGNLKLKNNGSSPLNIKGISIGSPGGGLNPVPWTPIANAYDEPPGNGTVDPNDPWTITSSTALLLAEREQSVGGDGGTLAVGQEINFGNVWIKSRIEDIAIDVELVSGTITTAATTFSGGPMGQPFHRSDLNVDGNVNANDWPLFFPNLLVDMSSFTAVQRALKGDLDADGDNDIQDFALFKADFDAVNGLGAFQAMLEAVPEPSSLALVVVAGLGLLARRRGVSRRGAPIAVAMLLVAGLNQQAVAQGPVDFTTYTTEAFPPAASFAVPTWTITPSTATHPTNADASVVYSPASALGRRFIGRLTPGTDDDVVGFVLGFEPGDAQINSTADYLLLDWKGATQAFDFADGDLANFHHDQTPSGNMPVGLALSRVTGSPTADEMWQHADLPENATGGVAELARGATLGSAAYNRTNGSHLFDISYTSTRVTVSVDGVKQIDLPGSFPDGRFGLYSAFQGPPATFADFQEFPTSFVGLSATVDRATGNITLRNTGPDAFSFDFYQIDSATSSLLPANWSSLSDQDFQTMGAGNGQSWDEAGGSDANSLGEAYLQSASTLASNASVSLGNIYNNAVNGGDLVLTYRLASGLVLSGLVRYAGDFDVDGDVDGGDFLLWQQQFGGPGSADANSSGLVDGADLAIWRSNFPVPSVVAAAPSGAAVPEASSLALMMGAAAGLASHWRRSR